MTVGRAGFGAACTYAQLLERGTQQSGRRCPRRTPTTPPRSSSPPAARARPRACSTRTACSKRRSPKSSEQYDLQPGGVDLACFALFGLFNSAMGVTTVFPDMDFSRPASADPRKLLAAAQRLARDAGVRLARGVGQAEPALRADGRPHPHAAQSLFLRRARAGRGAAPHAGMRRVPGAEMHTPYGATEALPVSTIEAREILGETAAATVEGRGRVRGAEVRFDRVAGDSHHGRADRVDRRRRRTADRRNWRADRARAAGVAGVCRSQSPAACGAGRLSDQSATGAGSNALEGRRSPLAPRPSDPRWRHPLASHGRRRLSSTPRPFLVLRPQVAARRNRPGISVSPRAVEAVFNQHPRSAPLCARRRRACGSANAGHCC